MTDAAPEERHATWLELFFDLVVVAAVGQLARLLHDRPELEDSCSARPSPVW
jgi:low temperature requirement protein LtrA